MGKWRQLTLAPILSGTPSKTTMRSRRSAKHRQMQREENTVDTGLTEEMLTAVQSVRMTNLLTRMKMQRI